MLHGNFQCRADLERGMPESPYDWTGKQTEKRDRQKRMLVVTAITMGALILVLGMVDGLLILLG
ncbi:hypothetical protein CQZ93_02640 [Ochrobactrum vermis]|nr:hypothetical protein CQZ93_02640 [Ochrobactrum vermis]